MDYLESIRYQYKTDFTRLIELVPSKNENEIDVISDDEDHDDDNFPNIPNEGDRENVRLCWVCLVKEVDTLIIPCWHAQTCNNSTEIISSSELNMCPVCRGPIEGFLQIFL